MKLIPPLLVLILTTTSFAQHLPTTEFHLTARPWHALNIPRDSYLDSVEGICRFTAQHQNPDGAIIDPFLKREHQYSTPYFAVAVGTLVRAGRAKDLLDHGIRAMDHATACFAKGSKGIPDNHGEFFIPALAEAVEIYTDLVPKETLERWRDRMKLPVDQITNGKTSNWRAYAMRGQWLRGNLGLIDRQSAIDYIEDSWLHAEQRDRIASDKLHLYEDHQTDPEPHAVEPVGRGNLLGIVAAGYDGPSATEMRQLVEDGTAVSLLLQDPTGQCPPDGRADDHVWNDVVYQLCFEVMAERAHRAGDDHLAGQYRHAAMLGFQSIQRWRHNDGSFSITKNRFDSSQRVGYQSASNITNYNGALAIHLAESYLACTTEISEQPSPNEIGGYAFTTDPKFATAVASAGGMQMFAALRGDTKQIYKYYWTSLGVNRFSRPGWDSRLGPSDGARDAASGHGVTFAPTWLENGKWIRLADVPERYQGKFAVQFAHPLLVRCAIDYAPIKGDGPQFRHEFLITPDGVLATLRSADTKDFGVTLPLLENDGSPLITQITNNIATTALNPTEDQQCFLALTGGDPSIETDDAPILSTYGYLHPLRVKAIAGINQTFVYPRNSSDPSATEMLTSFRPTGDGFDSQIGSVHGNIYIGRTSAGGEGRDIDINGDGKPDAVFDAPCRFVLQLRAGKIIAVETDRNIHGVIDGKEIALQAYRPASPPLR